MALSQADLLDLWRRLFPESYTQPFEDEAGGRSLDLIASIASVFARVAVAVETTTQAMYVFPHSEQLSPPASGSARASGMVTVTRTPPTDGVLSLEDGDQLSTFVRSADGVDVVEVALEVDGAQTISDSIGPTNVAVRAARAGHHGNVPAARGRSVRFLRRTTATVTGATVAAGNVITPGTTSPDRFDAGMVDAFVRFTGGSNIGRPPRRIESYNDATGAITVDGAALLVAAGTESLLVVDLETLGCEAEVEAAGLSGGTAPWLDQIGGERRRGRNAFESDATYRARIRELPDVVAPNSLYRAASRILTPLGLAWELKEARACPGREPYSFRGFFADVDPLDDPDADVRNERVLLGDRMERQGFIILVEAANYGDFGACVDYTPPLPGVHPSNAVDWMACDGWPEGFWADLRRLCREVEDARAAGVPWLLCLVDSLP